MNKDICIEGTVVDILPIVTGSRSDGSAWASQTYVLQTDNGGGFTSLVAFEIFDEARIRQWAIRRGERLTAYVNISSVMGREGTYFTHLRAWKISRGLDLLEAIMKDGPRGGGGGDDLSNILALLIRMAVAKGLNLNKAMDALEREESRLREERREKSEESLAEVPAPAPPAPPQAVTQKIFPDTAPVGRPGDELPF